MNEYIFQQYQTNSKTNHTCFIELTKRPLGWGVNKNTLQALLLLLLLLVSNIFLLVLHKMFIVHSPIDVSNKLVHIILLLLLLLSISLGNKK